MYLKFFIIFAGICLFATISTSNSHAINWDYSLEESLIQAATKGKPIMIDFYGEYCGWCKKLDKETFSATKVNSLSKKFICVKIDGNKNSNLLKKYKISGFPTIIFLDENGKEIKRIIGYRDHATFIEVMQKVLDTVSSKRQKQ